MRGFTILISLILMIIFVGVAGGGSLLWGFGFLIWLVIVLTQVQGERVEQDQILRAAERASRRFVAGQHESQRQSSELPLQAPDDLLDE